jgi:cell division protein FtsW
MARPKAGRGKSLQRISFDLPLVLIVAFLLIFGVLMVYSASSDFSYLYYGDPTHILVRQLIFIGAGILVACFTAWLDYHWWRKLALPAMGVTLVLLLAVLFSGSMRLGAVRSLFSGSVQPSELAKLVVVIYLSVWLYNRRDQLHEFTLGLLPLGTILGLVGGFIASQPDISAVLTVIILGMMMFFLAGGSWKQLTVVMGLGSLVGWLVLRSGVSATGTERITSFISGIQDPTKYSHHVQRAIEAFIQGGWLGAGLGNSRTKLLSLPFPHTDSIFAVIGEELGVWGAVMVLLLFVGLLWRGLMIARRAPDGLGSLLAGGLAFWLVLEAFINMAVMVGLMPFAGNALPFISAGGSSLLTTMTAVGILLNISRMSARSKTEEDSSGAVVNLRRRDGRRRVSRDVRSASYED